MRYQLVCAALLAAILVAACSSGGPGQDPPTLAAPTVAASPSVSTVLLTSTPTVMRTSVLPTRENITPVATEERTTATPGGTTVVTATLQVTATPPMAAGLAVALRSGGYVLYFRHAATDPVPDDTDPVNLADCNTQRNLSAAGRRQAEAIGAEIKRLGIPIGAVLASPFCRALDTARLAFGQATPEPVLENLETAKSDAERQSRIEGLQRLLATAPDPATNTVLVAHGFNISAAANVSIAEGEAAVFRPEGQGRFTFVGRVPADTWAQLAAAPARLGQIWGNDLRNSVLLWQHGHRQTTER